jgi:predicted ribosome-associated RNA-binding protein Tma20
VVARVESVRGEIVTLDRGARDGLLPGSQGALHVCAGAPRSFVIERVYEHRATARVAGAEGSKWSVIPTVRACAVVDDRVVARVTSVTPFDDGRTRVQLDRGASSGILPGGHGQLAGGVPFEVHSASEDDAVILLPPGSAVVAPGARAVVQRTVCR